MWEICSRCREIFVPRVEGYVIKREFDVVAAHQSTQETVLNALRDLLHSSGYSDSCRDYFTTGMFQLYQLIVEAFVEAAEIPEVNETFALCHADLDI